MQYLIIDRFEGAFVLCEDAHGTMHRLSRDLLPHQAAPGDVLAPEGQGWRIDAQETAARRARIRRKLDSLWEE